MNNNEDRRLKNTMSLKEFELLMGGVPLEFQQYNPEKRSFATLPSGKRVFIAHYALFRY